MGRKAAVSYDNILMTLSKLDIFHSNGQLKTQTYPVWNEACNLLQNKIKCTNLYLYVHHDRNGIQKALKDKILKFKPSSSKLNNNDSSDDNILNNDITNDEVSGSEGTSDDDSSPQEITDNASDYEEEISEGNKNPQNCSPCNFIIELDENSWNTIKPIDYKLPAYKWTPLIARKIYAVKKIPCAYRFRVGKVYKTLPHKYFDFYGRCKEEACKSYIYGVCKKNPDNDSDGVAIIHIETFDTRHIKHSQKRPCFGEERKKTMEVLQYVKASRYRHELADQLMDYSDIEPPFLSTTISYRKMREEAQNKYLGFKGPKDVIKSLIFLMNEDHFIREVCSIPLRVWYWSIQQIHLWNELAEINYTICLDATGGVVKKNTINEENCSDVFLYQLLSWYDGRCAPLCQMVTSRHDINIIRTWLNEWKTKIKIMPRESVTDDALALLNSICLTFNNCVYKEYLHVCLNYLQGINEILPFSCYVRLDRAHLIKSVTRWKCLNENKNKMVKDFYVRIIAYVITLSSLHEIEDVFLSTFIISESKSITEGTECHKRYKELITKLKNFEPEKDNEKDQINLKKLNNTEKDIEDQFSNNGMINYLNAIYDKAVKLADSCENITSMPNELYCPSIKKNLMFTYAQFPAWTSAMQTAFKSKNDAATSARIEAYFKDLFNTHGVFLATGNKFILRHKKIIQSQIKIAKSELKNSKKVKVELHNDKKIISEKNVHNVSEVEESENVEKMITFDEKKVEPLNVNDNFKKIFDVEENADSVNFEKAVDVEETAKLEKMAIEDEPNKSINVENFENIYVENSQPEDNNMHDNNNNIYANMNFKNCVNDYEISKICEPVKQNLTNKEKENSTNYLVQDYESKTIGKTQDLASNENDHDIISLSSKVSHNQEIIQKKKFINQFNFSEKGNELLHSPIKNGNLLDPIMLKNKPVFFRNTCAFDSISEVLIFSYKCNQAFQNFVNTAGTEQNNSYCRVLINYINNTNSMEQIYASRAFLMLPYGEWLDDTRSAFDCTCNVIALFENLLQHQYSAQRTVKCVKCGHERVEKCRVLTVAKSVACKLIQYSSDNFIEECIKSTFTIERLNCRKCKCMSSYTDLNINHFLALDMEDIFATYKISFNEIPLYITFKNVRLHLTGFVAFRSIGNQLHYYTLCYNKLNNVWEIKDDLRCTEYIKMLPTNVKIALLIYVKSID